MNLRFTTEPKLHNLPKERYLPAEVTPENRNHVPRRGIELEAIYQKPQGVSTGGQRILPGLHLAILALPR